MSRIVVNIAHMIKHKNLPFRLLLLAFVCIPIVCFSSFYQHFYVYLTGNVINDVIRDQWNIALLSIVVFLACLIPLSFRRRVKWAEYGLVSAFFISLFVEMYGIPLTILFAQKWFYQTDTALPGDVIHFSFLGVSFGMDFPMAYSAVLMIIGAVVIVGWVSLYLNVKKCSLVVSGIYSYSRHPQYFGFILIILGWFIGWPTILTVVLAPILIYKYVRVCQTEEKEMAEISDYRCYREKVPFFV